MTKRKNPEDILPSGRPTKYQEAFDERVIELMAKGVAIKELPYHFGICLDTIYGWAKANPTFSDALKKGKELSESWWLNAGRENLKDKDFSYVGWYMNMKNRFKWADRRSIFNPRKLDTLLGKTITQQLEIIDSQLLNSEISADEYTIWINAIKAKSEILSKEEMQKKVEEMWSAYTTKI